jgi:hypothetical protein
MLASVVYRLPRRPGRCVRADAAADLAALLARGLRSVRAAADAAFAPVTSALRTWVSADAAADFAALLARGLRRILPAADAARLPVLSPRLPAMTHLLSIKR